MSGRHISINAPGGVTYDEMVEYISQELLATLSGVTISGIVYYDDMVEYVAGELSTFSGVTLSGVTYDEMVQYVAGELESTLSGITISGVVYYQDMVQYVNTVISGTISGVMYGSLITGAGEFTASGTASIYHGFDTLNHFTSVVPGGPAGFDEEALAKVGPIYIELGLDEDSVFTTGGTTASGHPYIWFAITGSGTGTGGGGGGLPGDCIADIEAGVGIIVTQSGTTTYISAADRNTYFPGIFE